MFQYISSNIQITVIVALTFLLPQFLPAQDTPANTWVRIADCPGDDGGREIPPGRGATWVYCPPLKGFVRYGGFTPRFSNAMDIFDPSTKKWTRIWGEDETYPDSRPGGGMLFMLQWDETKQKIIMGGGKTSALTGSRGVFEFDPKTYQFTCLVKDVPAGVPGMAYDIKANLVVGSCGAGSDSNGRTWVLPLQTGKWEMKDTKPCPQDTWTGGYPMVYHEELGKIVSMGNFNKEFCVWVFDSQKFVWEKLDAPNGPSPRSVYTMAYDVLNKVILFYGISKTGSAEPLNDTWVFDVTKKEWKEIKCPGIPPLRGINNREEIVYKSALTYDPTTKQMLLCDPDLGVWAFRYDPSAGAGTEVKANGFEPKVNAAAKNPPAEVMKGREDQVKEKRMTFPTPLNPKISDLGDNSIVELAGGRQLFGHEVGWTYDSDAGVFLKYGGCGNNCHPHWTGYSNSLLVYDPGTEKTFVRRVCDISGAARPATGCTRSVAYDVAHKLTWLFGGVGSGPYCPGTTNNSVSYNILTDCFESSKTPFPDGFGNTGCLVQMSQEGQGFFYNKDVAFLFDSSTGAWSKKATKDGPEKFYVYNRIAYIKSKKAFLVLGINGEPADAKTNKPDTQNNQTYLYDPVNNTWQNLKPEVQPPFRSSKFGLAYDSKNDIVLLVGGGIGWNVGHRRDMWIYDVKANTWQEIKPQLTGNLKQVPVFDDGMHCDYDIRHNAFILKGQEVYAYRYKK